MLLYLIIISFLYFSLIIALIIGFYNVPYFERKETLSNQQFTVIIPFRNEAENISALAESLQKLAYSNTQFEVIWVDDESTDDSVVLLTKFIVKNTHWKLIKNHRKSNSPKKDAINTAILQANYEWILTTDADCIVPKNWLKTFGNFIDSQEVDLKMIAGPVAYKTDNSFLQNFQKLDFLSLIGATIGSFGIGKPFMCNGANLCYRKDAFFAVNGFDGNDTIASGDDVFLLEKMIVTYSNAVTYLKSVDALVITKPETNFKDLLNQRVRWASKMSATKNWFGKLVGVLVFLMNLITVLILVLTRSYSEMSQLIVPLWILLVLKFVIDFVLIYQTYLFTNLKGGLKQYVFSFFIYPVFVMYVVGLSFFKKVKWKGRVI